MINIRNNRFIWRIKIEYINFILKESNVDVFNHFLTVMLKMSFSFETLSFLIVCSCGGTRAAFSPPKRAIFATRLAALSAASPLNNLASLSCIRNSPAGKVYLAASLNCDQLLVTDRTVASEAKPLNPFLSTIITLSRVIESPLIEVECISLTYLTVL